MRPNSFSRKENFLGVPREAVGNSMSVPGASAFLGL